MEFGGGQRVRSRVVQGVVVTLGRLSAFSWAWLEREGWRMRSGGLARVVDVLWVLVFGVLGSVWCVTAGERIGPTFDEPVYLESGLHFWRTGSLAPQ